MTRLLFPILLSLFATIHASNKRPSVHQHMLRYSIGTLWDGSPIKHDKPATVQISADPSGGLRVTVEASFFNSPAPQEPFQQKCPERPYFGLWNYEVVEVFLLNDDERYIEVEFSPRGRHIVLLLKSERKDALHTLPLQPAGVELHNPCFGEGNAVRDGCNERWVATAVIPREYLPPRITKMNAYAIHGNTWGESSPPEENKSYESLFPADPAVSGKSGPDFHYLEGFKPVDLAQIGYEEQTEYSPLWQTAVEEDGDIEFKHEILRTADCAADIESDGYRATIKTSRNSQRGSFTVEVTVREDEDARPVVPSELSRPGPNPSLDTSSESIWLSLTSRAEGKSDSLRVGVNPDGAYQVSMINSDGKVVSQGRELQDVKCRRLTVACWTCRFTVDSNLLPPEVGYFQAVHFHRPLIQANGRYGFVGATCPGFELSDVDWRGCGTDARLFAKPNKEYSGEWKEALGL